MQQAPETLPLHQNVRVLATHPSGIFALEKPAGVMTHPNAPGLNAAKNALLVADYSLKNECYFTRDAGGSVRKIFVLNRLDSPTSGIVLCAENEKIAKLARTAFAEAGVQKTYYALVRGNVPPKAIWKDFLIKENVNGNLHVRVAPHGKLRGARYAETAVELVRGNTLYSLVKLFPKTGRTHQLRVQCASHGFPILGDKAYGNFSENKKLATARLFLHAAETEIAFPWQGREIRFSAVSPIPEIFDETLGEYSPKPATPPKATEKIGRFSVRIRKK